MPTDITVCEKDNGTLSVTLPMICQWFSRDLDGERMRKSYVAELLHAIDGACRDRVSTLIEMYFKLLKLNLSLHHSC